MRRRLPLLASLLSAALLGAAGCGDGPHSVAGSNADPGSLAGEPAPSADATPGSSATPTEPKSTPPKPAQQKLVDKTFDDIKFEMDKEEAFERAMITPEIEELAGRRIRIRGYMLPAAQKRGLKSFVLVRDNQECCFGPGAALYDCILIHMRPGKTAEFSIRPVAVEGTFRIDEWKGPTGDVWAIYHLDGEAVR